MRAWWILVALTLATFGCERYSANDLELATAYRARELCSCLFVARHTMQFCDEMTAIDPPLATFSVDQEHQVVESQALLMWSNRARFVDKRSGCVLE